MIKVINKYQTSAKTMGVPLTGTPKLQLLKGIRKNLQRLDNKKLVTHPLFITTPNPEHVLLFLKDSEFATILRSSSYSLPDGYGLVIAAKYLSLKTANNLVLRIPLSFIQGLWVGCLAVFARGKVENRLKVIKGREFFLDLIDMANKKKWRVFLLGGEKNVAEKAVSVLSAKYKKVKFAYHQGPILDSSGRPLKEVSSDNNKLIEKEAIKKINRFRPHILFVGMTMPKQEKWLYRHIKDLDIGAAMVVGGTFDYTAGTVKIPPKFMGSSFEWLWRLIVQPKMRLGRIFNATVVFPFKVFVYKLRNPESS